MILEKARELGIALSETMEFRQMIQTRAALDANEAVSALLQEFQQKQQELVELLSEDDPDRLLVSALSRDVEMLQEALTSNAIFADTIRAQNAFQVLMKQVNTEIASCIGMQSGEDACEGSCEGCAGCRH